jgi:hypothetical protein
MITASAVGRRAPRGLARAGLLLVAGLGCGEPSVTRPDGGPLAFLDARGMTPAPETPILEAVPERVPYTVATLRGQAGARRVIVESSANPVAATVLPDGSFCVDAPMPQPGEYSFRVYAQGADGQLSERPAVVSVRFDPAAPSVPGAQTCSGGDPAGCAGSVEICDNRRDDDCNNLVDERDPACATCADDPLEPNDDASAPRVDPRRYDGLMICPGDVDYYGVLLREGETLSARLFFTHAMGNLDLELLATDRRTVLARSTSTTDDELLSYTASVAGEHKLLVFGPGGSSNRYALDLRVDPR